MAQLPYVCESVQVQDYPTGRVWQVRFVRDPSRDVPAFATSGELVILVTDEQEAAGFVPEGAYNVSIERVLDVEEKA